MSFADLGLSPELLQAVEESGYTTPTPIQQQAIPVVLMGRDVLGCAQTGTGKTASFTLPMIEILAAGRAKARMPRSLILAPTRELAAQVAENFDKYGKYHKLSKALIIGGESMSDQVAILDRGVDVLIATPGRLLDMFERGRILLNDVKVLVIDEADRMLDMGFIPDVQRIVSLLPKIRQTLFFSATLGPEIRKLADEFLMNPKEITVSAQSSTAVTVEQFLAVVDHIDKRETLRHIIRIENLKNAFIFCNRKRDVDILYKSLKKHGFDVVQMHGDMSQPARLESLSKFKSGEARLLVCSDVVARGIDIKAVSHVFNFDVPIHAEDYVHRIGRTGRAGETGRAFTIAAPEDGKFVAAIESLIAQPLPRMSVEGVPPLDLDMSPRRGRGRPGDKKEDGRKPRRSTGKSQDQDQQAPAAEARTETPAPAESRDTERRRDRPERDRPERPERDRSERQDRERAPRERNDRDRNDRDRGDRDRGDRRRDDRGGRRRGRIDELGIGEMTHPDNVVGFGEHMPDFMTRMVQLPVKSGKDSDTETESAEE
ncbi:DEAD/DEAH box helicase [Magnetospirillum sp. 64-120]|uniref:DEAD/DEAH box helicase n=1 Tax=Magnetospirillum sp. 64-120 TaxID=1895778 RepID=UPI0009287142|nr:DEAD/DEAH box helicase [Magnetospirillum sp. 64-120]OJX79360.1 MAG: DNA helicase [Magnetospirillum sp. 64-120]